MTKPTIVTRAGKGDTLSFTEVDANFTNLQNATVGITDGTNSGTLDLNDTLTFTGNVTYNASTKTLTISGVSSLAGLSDVVLSTPTNQDVLIYSGSFWYNTSSAPKATGVLVYADNTTNATRYIPFFGAQGDGSSALSPSTDSGLTYNPSTGTLTSTNFAGVASSATYASAVTLTADNTTAATNYPLFANAATGNLSPRTDTGFTYNPSTGVLTATQFSGSGAGLTSIPNSALTNSSITFGATATSLGGTVSALNSVSIGATTASTGKFTSLQMTSLLETGGTATTATGAYTYAPNAANGTVQTLNMSTATSLTFSAFTTPVAGQSLTVIVTNGTGAVTTFTSTMKWAGAVKSLTAGSGSVDVISVYYDGTNYYASISKGFA